jgi:hypothetical protein
VVTLNQSISLVEVMPAEIVFPTIMFLAWMEVLLIS